MFIYNIIIYKSVDEGYASAKPILPAQFYVPHAYSLKIHSHI